MVSRLILMILVLFLFAGQSHTAEMSEEKFDMHAISGALKQAEERAETMSVLENPDAEAGRKTAETLMKQFQEPEYQAKIRAEQQRLRQTVFQEVLAEFEPKVRPDAPVGKLAADERVHLFFSSSVELSTLRSYAAMIDRAGDPNVVMVLRGFVGGMKRIKPTMDFIGNVLKKDPACDVTVEKCDGYNVSIQVDPLLFQRFRVEQVPTVVYGVGQPVDGESSEGQDFRQDFTISGDAGLDWLLEKINREAKSETLAGLIGSMRGGIEGKP
jgi:conjugal transfer pilus assembly protein TrbC